MLVVAAGKSEVALFESNVICEYIEDTQGGPKLHPQDPLERAQHRAWMEFGSTILSDLWGLETTGDAAIFESKRRPSPPSLRASKLPWAQARSLPAENFSLVDAVFAPIFRYFDVFDQLSDLAVFTGTPKVRAWRAALARRPSVQAAVDLIIRICCARFSFVTTRIC